MTVSSAYVYACLNTRIIYVARWSAVAVAAATAVELGSISNVPRINYINKLYTYICIYVVANLH